MILARPLNAVGAIPVTVLVLMSKLSKWVRLCNSAGMTHVRSLFDRSNHVTTDQDHESDTSTPDHPGLNSSIYPTLVSIHHPS